MKRLILATAAAAAIATPAQARDNSWYAGIEAGVLKLQDLDLDYEDEDGNDIGNAIEIDHDLGFDVDLIGGYDFGSFRVEAETAYKRASVDGVDFDDVFLDPDDGELEVDADGRATALSAMANVLFDAGADDGIGFYAGGGIGLARVKYRVNSGALGIGFRDTDDTIAWQLIAGVRAAVSPSMDVGLKYRYFRTGKLDFEGDQGLNAGGPFDLDGRWRSHSLLASLIFNFAPPPPLPVILPPPPPPPPPATQVCPDGSVILATDICPAPPPPPPPPPPAGERG